VDSSTAGTGMELSTEDALAFALEESPATASTEPPVTSPLTRREHQVAALVARGLSNKDIAGTLVISPRTAEAHVEHILVKLGFTTRAQIAAWVAATPAVR
jgi:non-specific serine/threonine protein kinase